VSETEPVTCDYILVTGNRRGCPAGEGCERYIKGERAPSIDQQLYKGRKLEKPEEKPKEKPKDQKPRKKKPLTPEQLAKKREQDKEYYQRHKKELNKRRYEREKQRRSP
jgi:hypothetical protein